MMIWQKSLSSLARFRSRRLFFVSTYAVQNSTVSHLATATKFFKPNIYNYSTVQIRRENFKISSCRHCRFLSTNERSKTSSQPLASNSPRESKAASENQNGTEIPQEEHYAYIQSITDRLHYIEESMRIRGHSVLKWGLGLVMSVLLGLYMFREPLRDNVADEIADVASRSLADDGVKNNVNEMTKAVLQDIVNNSETTKLASNFVISVLSRDDVKEATLRLTYNILSDSETQKRVNIIAGQALTQLLYNDATRKTILEFLKTLILDPSTKDALQALFQDVIQDPDVKEFMSRSVAEVVTSSVVTDKAVALGKSITHEVVSDRKIQDETGDAMWKALKHSVTPGWFSN